MQTIPQDQIEAKLGKNRYWFPKELANLVYLYGIPVLDEAYDSTATQQLLALKSLPGGLQMSIFNETASHSFGLAYADIKQIELVTPEEIKTKQEKSVIGRAVLGGLLSGPAGAVVSGLTGLFDEQKGADFGDALLTIQVEQGHKEGFIVAKVSQEKRSATKVYLYKNLKRFTK